MAGAGIAVGERTCNVLELYIMRILHGLAINQPHPAMLILAYWKLSQEDH